MPNITVSGIKISDVTISGITSISGNVNCYGSSGKLFNQDGSGLLNVNVATMPNVTVSGITISDVTISGTPAITISGTPAVTISGTTTISGKVGIYGNQSTLFNQDGSGNLYVNISGTPAVTISGTPAITISGTPSVNISGTPAVTISGTPAVTISGTPAVTISGITTISGIITISGTPNVTISGDISGYVSPLGSQGKLFNQDVSGLLNVNVATMPNITVSGITISAVTISGTPSVTISGTPSVTISGITTISGKVGIYGNKSTLFNQDPSNNLYVNNLFQTFDNSGNLNVKSYGSNNLPINQDLSGILNVNVLTTPTVNVSGIFTVSGNTTMLGNAKLPVNQSDVDGTLYVNDTSLKFDNSGNLNVKSYGSNNLPINQDLSGILNVNVLTTPTVNVSGIFTVSGNTTMLGNAKLPVNQSDVDGTLYVNDTSLKFDNSGNLNMNLNSVNQNFVTGGGLNTYIVNNNPIPVSISGYVTQPPVQYDAFGRFRVSEPFTIFDSSNVNYLNTKFSSYVSSNVSGGLNSAITYNVNNSMVGLNCTSNNGLPATVIREGKYTCIYQPGKSLLILNSFVMTPTIPGVIQRVGYYNDANGIYLEYNPADTAGNLKMVLRTSISGTVDNSHAIYQSAWQSFNTPNSINIGTGLLMWIDIEWLGVGTVRTGFIYNEQYYICAQFNHANIIGNTSPYMTSAQLAPRYEIINSTITPAILNQICSTVISEGGFQGNTPIRHIGTSYLSGTQPFPQLTPILAIKLNDTISGTKQNVGINGIVLPSQLDFVSASSNNNGIYLYQVLINPTISGSFTWTSYSNGYNSTDKNSSVQFWAYNGSGPSYTETTGLMVNSGYVSNNSSTTLANITDFNYQIGRSYTGSTTGYTSDIIVVVVQSYSAAQNFAAQIGWYEF